VCILIAIQANVAALERANHLQTAHDERAEPCVPQHRKQLHTPLPCQVSTSTASFEYLRDALARKEFEARQRFDMQAEVDRMRDMHDGTQTELAMKLQSVQAEAQTKGLECIAAQYTFEQLGEENARLRNHLAKQDRILQRCRVRGDAFHT
jgi:hypothetical protein